MFYVIVMTLSPGYTILDVQNALAPAKSYYRIAPNVWVVSTYESSTTWYNRLIPFFSPVGRVFISRLDMSDRYGLMDPAFWDWIEQQGGF